MFRKGAIEFSLLVVIIAGILVLLFAVPLIAKSGNQSSHLFSCDAQDGVLRERCDLSVSTQHLGIPKNKEGKYCCVKALGTSDNAFNEWAGIVSTNASEE
jgi:hypothetical protein